LKQKLHIAFTILLIVVGVYILFTDYTPQTQGQSIILAFSIILLMMVLFLHIKGDGMAEDENIVKATCRELGVTYKDIKGIRDSVLDGFLLYYKENLDSVNLSKSELSKLLDRVRELNTFEAIDPKDTPEMIRQLLSGELIINSDGTTNKIVPMSQIVEDMPFLDGILNTKTNINIKTEEITPLFVKNFCKEQNWTYKDLAEHIGSVEGTVRSWTVKGAIPLWAQKSISYIVEIERLKNDADSSAYLHPFNILSSSKGWRYHHPFIILKLQ